MMLRLKIYIYNKIRKSKLTKSLATVLKKAGLKNLFVSIFFGFKRSIFSEPTIVQIDLSNNLNFEILVNPKYGDVDWKIFQNKIWESNITKTFISKIKPGYNVFDIGANIGYFTLLSAILVKTQGTVHAFEPQKEIFETLKKNISINSLKNVIINNQGLGDNPGYLELTQIPGNRGGGRILEKQIQNGTKEIVNITTLDDYINLNDVRSLDFIKIDVEGFELEVLNGGSRAIRNFRPICLFEFSPDIWRKYQANWIQKSRLLLNFFLELEYNLYDLDYSESVTPSKLDEYILQFQKRRQSNIIATFTKNYEK